MRAAKAADTGTELKVAQAMTRVDQLRADTGQRLAAIVADGVSEATAVEWSCAK